LKDVLPAAKNLNADILRDNDDKHDVMASRKNVQDYTELIAVLAQQLGGCYSQLDPALRARSTDIPTSCKVSFQMEFIPNVHYNFEDRKF
jgi:hypothetical protein